MGEQEKTEKAGESKPSVKLIGEDGNAFSILGNCRRAALKAGWTEEQWAEFRKEALAEDYDHLLATVQEHFDVC